MCQPALSPAQRELAKASGSPDISAPRSCVARSGYPNACSASPPTSRRSTTVPVSRTYSRRQPIRRSRLTGGKAERLHERAIFSLVNRRGVGRKRGPSHHSLDEASVRRSSRASAGFPQQDAEDLGAWPDESWARSRPRRAPATPRGRGGTRGRAPATGSPAPPRPRSRTGSRRCRPGWPPGRRRRRPSRSPARPPSRTPSRRC